MIASENWLDNRHALGATGSHGLLIVVAANVALVCAAATDGVLRLRCD